MFFQVPWRSKMHVPAANQCFNSCVTGCLISMSPAENSSLSQACCWALIIGYACNNWEERLHRIKLMHSALCILLAEGSSQQREIQLIASAMNLGVREIWIRHKILNNIYIIFTMLTKYNTSLPHRRQDCIWQFKVGQDKSKRKRWTILSRKSYRLWQVWIWDTKSLA